DRPWLCEARESKTRASHIDLPASSYAIMRRARPYRGENPGPGKDVHRELDHRPGIREQPRSVTDVVRNHCNVRFSNRPVRVKHFQTHHRCCVDVRSRARASLRNRHQGPSTMGFEDEVEQSLARPCRQTNGRSKRTCELTSSVVPRGTSFHRLVELEFPLLDLILKSFMPLPRLVLGSNGTRYHRPICGA